MKDNLVSIRWDQDRLILLDQTKLPLETIFIEVNTIEEAWTAIKKLIVRGAPAIGIAAAFGLYLGVRNSSATDFQSFFQELRSQSAYLATSRPTAVNLSWALNRMERALLDKGGSVEELKTLLLQEAQIILEEDEHICRQIGEHGLSLLKDGMTVLTHCNAGSYATARYGTALAPIYLAQEKGWQIKVYAGETRPLLQGSRLTAHELLLNGIDVTLITDSMAAYVMQKGWIDAVIVGADRVAANGDTANKIGTYGLAVLAKEHEIPFFIACPTSTIDLKTATGQEIIIEERNPQEIIQGFGKITAPPGVKVFNPAFDVTPYQYITALITEKGVVYPPFKKNLWTIA
ncbi:MAG: S-methyl-5-thioribose-1-phosphate isomerase [Bacillota bacterium]